MRLLRSVALCCAVISPLSCSSDERPGTYDSSEGLRSALPLPLERLPEVKSTFTETDCAQLAKDHAIQCGFVEVPESPGSEAVLKIAVARVFTNSSSPKSDPIVYLEGGPGVGSLANVDLIHSALLEVAPDRDFIFVDQRGIGESRPRLNCIEGAEEEDPFGACFERLEEKVSLDAFNTANNATDIDLIRKAFGYDEWNLLGISYGTRLGLTIMRDHPEGLRSVILDSVVPLQADLFGEIGRNGFQALERAFAACAADSDCDERYPDPMGQLVSITEDLNEKALLDSSVISGSQFVRLVFQLLYSPRGVELVPLVIDQGSEGEFEFFGKLEEAVTPGVFAFGMHLSLQCSEEISFSSVEAFEAFDSEVPEALRPALSGEAYFEYCEHWPVADAPAIENEAVKSDIPSLVMGGYYDPITPPAFAEAAHESLENSQLFVLQAESHGASLSPCGFKLLRAFLESPEEEVTVACSNDVPSFEFASTKAYPARKSTLGGKLSMKTEVPSDEELADIIEDLQRRLR